MNQYSGKEHEPPSQAKGESYIKQVVRAVRGISGVALVDICRPSLFTEIDQQRNATIESRITILLAPDFRIPPLPFQENMDTRDKQLFAFGNVLGHLTNQFGNPSSFNAGDPETDFNYAPWLKLIGPLSPAQIREYCDYADLVGFFGQPPSEVRKLVEGLSSPGDSWTKSTVLAARRLFIQEEYAKLSQRQVIVIGIAPNNSVRVSDFRRALEANKNHQL